MNQWFNQTPEGKLLCANFFNQRLKNNLTFEPISPPPPPSGGSNPPPRPRKPFWPQWIDSRRAEGNCWVWLCDRHWGDSYGYLKKESQNSGCHKWTKPAREDLHPLQSVVAQQQYLKLRRICILLRPRARLVQLQDLHQPDFIP